MLCICQGQHANVWRTQQGEQHKPVQNAPLLLHPFKTFFLCFGPVQRARPSFVAACEGGLKAVFYATSTLEPLSSAAAPGESSPPIAVSSVYSGCAGSTGLQRVQGTLEMSRFPG